MKYIANQEIQTEKYTFLKSQEVPNQFVTSRMKEMCLVSPVYEKEDILTETTSKIDISTEPIKQKRKKNECK